MRRAFIVLAALLWLAAPARAQSSLCDGPNVTTVEVGQAYNLCWDSDGLDVSGNPAQITAFTIYRNGALQSGVTIIQDAGTPWRRIVFTETTVGTVLYDVKAVNDKGESSAFSFQSLSVTPARTVPKAPVRGKVVK